MSRSMLLFAIAAAAILSSVRANAQVFTLTKEQLIEMALSDLRELVPESRDAQLVHSRIVKEREATLSHTTESDTLRPGPRTAIENLILAGGWTATGLPDTIESAVLSGHTAADIAASI